MARLTVEELAGIRSRARNHRWLHEAHGWTCEGDMDELLDHIDAVEAELARKDAALEGEHSKLLKIAAIVNAYHNGDDGELTPCQAAKQALSAVGDVLGEPF